MARGIMADDKGDKVATSPTSADESKGLSSPPCSCTKISTMQLFYEMKQKFPTVPDNVVCELVGQHCHNRSACIDGLEDYPANSTANVYPQALRNQPAKKKTQPSSIQNSITAKQKNADELSASKPPMPPSSSTTLNLTNLNCCTRPMVNRVPTRVAPPPPTNQPPKSAQQPLNLSVNVIVSPMSRAQQNSGQQHQYSFTLHQPNVGETSTATVPTSDTSPSLRYTSSAYDAEIGCQSRLEITVAGTTNADNGRTAIDNDGNSSISLRRSCEVTNAIAAADKHPLPSVVASSEFLEETNTVHQQILCKQKLVLEVDKDRKRLERMQRELHAIQAPMPDGGIDALNSEIERLRNDCKLMAQHVEDVSPAYSLGETNEAFYQNIYTGQQLPVPQQLQQQQRQPLRPHRTAPVPVDFSGRPKTVHANIVIGSDGGRHFPASPSSTTTTTTQSPNQCPCNETATANGGEEPAGWTCDLCTFQNKYTQRTCEACTMPFLSAVMSANGEDIHIHLFPGQNSVIHSWVVS